MACTVPNGTRWASGGSCGRLILVPHHQVGAGCPMGWAHCEVKVPDWKRVPGGEKKNVQFLVALYVRTFKFSARGILHR